ncbi:hypothetical protein B0H19DRAFT_639766 [Mycena capillaripes]|nr:hypothetical protein B0H19DRAFT_639766 [Mycena capillaripes]
MPSRVRVFNCYISLRFRLYQKLHNSFRGFFTLSKSRVSDTSTSTSTLGSLFRRKRKTATVQSIFDNTAPSSPSNSLFVFSVLGVAGLTDYRDVGWMLHDWLMFLTLLVSHPKFDGNNFRYRCIRPVLGEFPDRSFLSGETGCNRLQIPIPQSLFDSQTHMEQENLTAEDFALSTILDLATIGSRLQPGDKLVLLLVGHGERSPTGEFLFCITTKSNRQGEAWLTKRKLELGLEQCRGEIIVICNSCYSGGLQSDRWQLLCAAGPTELSEALSASASGQVRGSAFSQCALAERSHEQGLVIPVPRSEKRPETTADGDLAPLPTSPPLHSFVASSRPIHPLASSRTAPALVDGMMERENFLIQVWQSFSTMRLLRRVMAHHHTAGLVAKNS